MAGGKAERVLILLFSENLISRAELLNCRVVKSSTFLHFCGNKETLTLGFSHFGLNVAPASYGECICGDIAAIASEHFCYGVPKRGLTISATSVGNDKCLKEYLADSSKAAYLLYVIDEFLIIAEDKVQTVFPYLCAFMARGDSGYLCNVVLGVVFLGTSHAFAKVVGGSRGTE